MTEFTNETIIPLPSGETLRSGSIDPEFTSGEYVRLCDPEGNELFYWDHSEWRDDPVLVMGAIFGAVAMENEFKPWAGFTEDGFDTYLVQVNVTGIENDLCVLVPGESNEDAWNCAAECITSLKHNDIGLKNIKNLGR